MRATLAILLALLASAFLASAALATDYGVFVDGSYSPGRANSAMDRLIDDRLAEASRIMGKRNPGSSRQTVDNKSDLESALDGIDCKCGDTITIVLMGHGGRNRFQFSKASGSNRTLTADDLADWLEGAAVECCCKIHVVIFSCHSGSFVDELMEKEHIQSAWASSKENEKSYSDAFWDGNGTLVDEGDWLDGFLEDWEEAPASTDIGDDLEAGADSAEEKMPITQWPRQHPVGWRKGTHTVVAHVEKDPVSGTVKLHFWDPKFLRCTERDVDMSGVEHPDDLEPCDWVTFPGTFGKPSEPVAPGGAVTPTPAPTETVVAHVEGRGTSGGRPYLRVHTIRPKRFYCKKQRLYYPSGQLSSDVAVCTFIEETVTVDDPDERLSTGGSIAPGDPEFRVKIHVSGSRNQAAGTFRGHVLEPRFLRCRRWTVQLPAGERDKIPDMRTCHNVMVTVKVTSATATTIPGSDVQRIQRMSGSWSPGTDAAANVPQPLHLYLDRQETGDPPEVRFVVPMAAVTNVGETTIGGQIEGAIGLAEEWAAIRAWVLGEGPPPALVWALGSAFTGLDAGDTVGVEFQPWQLPLLGGDWYFVFRVETAGDEIEANDVGEIFFTTETEEPLPPLPTD